MVEQMKVVSLVDVLQSRAREQGDRVAFRFLSRPGDAEATISFAQLDRRARIIAGFLGSKGAQGDRVLLLYPAGLEYVAAFMGCLYAGMVAVPLYPPRPNQKLYRAGAVLEDCGAAIALTNEGAFASIRAFLDSSPAFAAYELVATDALSEDAAATWNPPTLSSDTLAFLQYTSGSTGTPKGVMVTHGNIIANEQTIVHAIQSTPDDVFVSWLPIYHDMGLIGTILQTVYCGFSTVLLPSAGFIRDPFWWLEVISTYKGTISGGPNFGYELCCDRVTPERLAGLDLSSWRLAFNGAEPVRGETLKRFARTFETAGFRESSFYPCYGMAETTLFITGGDILKPPPIQRYNREAIAANAQMQHDEAGVDLVGCGATHLTDRVCIVNPQTQRVCDDGFVGEIWVQSSGKALGYWGKEDLSQEIFEAQTEDGQGPFLRTGDLGFFDGGELFVSGRLKDLIILRGRNYYPQDIEQTVQRAHPALQMDGCAAFATSVDGPERLVVAIEVKRTHMRKLDESSVFNAIRAAVSEQHEVAVHEIVLLRPGRMLKTSSGKIQRNSCRLAFEAGELVVVASQSAHQDVPIESEPLDPKELLRTDQPQAVVASRLRSLVAQSVGLSIDQVDSTAPMLSLGLDSMGLISLQHALEKELSIRLPIDALLNGQSIDQLAQHVVPAIGSKGDGEARTAPLPERFPLAPNQENLYHFFQIAPESAAYHLPYAVQVRGALDVPALKQAYVQLLARHRMLRAGFVDGEVVVHPTVTPDWREVDASDWDEAAVLSYMEASARRPFDPARPPLLRVDLLKRGLEHHYLLFNLHHIVGDMWSFMVLIDELGITYGQRGQNLMLQPLLKDYADFAASGHVYPETKEGEAAWNYWQGQLEGELPVLELPTDFPRPSQMRHQGAVFGFDCEPDLAQQLRAVAGTYQTTLFTPLLAAYQLALHRYSAQDDVLVGVSFNSRVEAGFAPVLGYFINPLVMRSRLQVGETWGGYLQETAKTREDALRFGAFPFQTLLERLAPQRQPGRAPLFQTMFTYQEPHQHDAASAFALRRSGATLPLGELTLESVALDPKTAQVDLIFFVAETSAGLGVMVEYNTDLFQEQTIQRICHLWQDLLRALVADAQISLDQLWPVGDVDHKLLLETWNQTAKHFRDVRPFYKRFLSAAAQYPDAVAVSIDEEQYTYAELKSRSIKLANLLAEHGVGPESAVAVCCDRQLFLIEAAVAVMLRGALYAPLDPAQPPERLGFILADSGARVVLAPESNHHLLPTDATILRPGDADNQDATYCAPGFDSSFAAYMIYTSGSTGKPKGVVTPYAGLANLINWHISSFNLEPGNHGGAVAAVGFDASVWEIWPPLLTGGELHLLPPGKAVDAAFLGQWLEDNTVRAVFLTTRLGLAVLDWYAQRNLEKSGVGFILLGGEKVPSVSHKLPFTLMNGYGPTENSAISNTSVIEPGAPPPIGRPNPNVTSYVLSARGHLVPIGASGELCLGGQSLARGYADPKLTAERFVPNPFGDAGERLYRTGDRVRYGHDGNIHFLGRVDFQVKLRGYRIEPEEIAHCLESLETVQAAVVLVGKEGAAAERLVAYVVKKGTFDADAARAHVAHHLPAYMVPAAFVPLDAWPLNPNGKLDRRALPIPGRQHLVGDELLVQPRNETEAVLCRIFAEVLGLEQVGVTDNFFHLGGDSILAIQIQTRCAKAGLTVGPSLLFTHPTISELVPRLESSVTRVVGTERTEGQVLPTPIQRWFLEAEMPDAHHFNQSVLLEVDNFSKADLIDALNTLIDHHDALRFRVTQQGINCKNTGHFHLYEVNLMGDEDQQRQWVLQETAKAQQSMDLASGRLMSAVLFQREDACNLLFLTLHHLIVDGVSWRILLEDLATLLRGETLLSRTTTLAAWSQKAATYRVDLNYWQKLNHARVLGEGLLSSEPTNREDEKQRIVRLDAAPILNLQSEHGVGISELLLAALMHALDASPGVPLLIDLEGHGRHRLFDDIDLARTVGWFTSMYPVGLCLTDGAGLVHDARSVHEQLAQVAHGGLDYALANHPPALPPRRALFNYLGRFDGAFEAPILGRSNWTIAPDRSTKGLRQHALELDALIIDDTLQVTLNFSSETTEATVERIHGTLRDGLLSLTGNFPLAPPEDRDRILAAYPDIVDLYPPSPVQEGMLFHALYHPASPTYFVQLVCRFEGTLDIPLFQQAWTEVIQATPALSSSFMWEDLGHPLTLVHKGLVPDWQLLNHASFSPEKQKQALQAFLKADQEQGFALDQPPLQRFTLLDQGHEERVFVWSHHHMLLDGWSLSQVLSDVFQSYRALQKGGPFTSHRTPYRKFVTWTFNEDRKAARAYWRQALENVSAPLQLPMDQHGSGQEAAVASMHLAPESFAPLSQLSRTTQLTLSTLIQGAWALMLSRYCHTVDVVFGLTVSGRDPRLDGVESIIGPLINSVPIYSHVDGEVALLAWLQALQVKSLEREPFNATPLPQIQSWASLESGTDLFETLVVVENYPLDSNHLQELLGVRVSDAHMIEHAQYPLTLIARPDQGLHFQLNYHTARFTNAAIHRMLEHLQTVLAAMPHHLHRPLKELSILPEGERRLLVHSWNQGAAQRPFNGGVLHRFHAQAKATPKSVALVLPENNDLARPATAVTYEELALRAKQIARFLRTHGAGPEVLVGLHMRRSPELIASLLGLLQSGAAYVPLDPVYPSERLAYMIEDSGLSLVLGDPDLEALPQGHFRVIYPEEIPEVDVRAEFPVPMSLQTAYIIYTSGSTGKPKGVPVPHGNIERLFSQTAHWFSFDANDVWTLFHSYAFDFTVWELWGALIHGGKLVIVPQVVARSTEDFHRLLIRQRVTVLSQTPSAFVRLVGWDEQADKHPSDLRHVIFGGEALEPKTMAPWFHRYGDQRPQMVNMYGITETTVHVTHRALIEDDVHKGGSNVGVRIPDLRLYLLDASAQPVPLGVAGEIYVGGAGVARGYLRKPSLTATRFVPDPYSDVPGARLYRSGDLGRFEDQGDLQYVGRTDFQVKIRGYRIELGEIEAVLSEVAEVRQALVMVREDLEGVSGKQLVAYVVSSRPPEVDDLHQHLHQSLPHYMVPGHFVFLSDLPLTAHGKIDRRKLPRPNSPTSKKKLSYMAPRNDVERALAEVWSDVLGVERVGIHDRFFEMGGDSIRSIRILSGVKSKGLSLSLNHLFEHQTIARLAPLVETVNQDEQTLGAFQLIADLDHSLLPEGVVDAYPATRLQGGMLFHGEMEEDAYHNLTSFILKAPFNQTRLTAAIESLMARHEVLRTAFDLERFAHPLQLVYAHIQTPVHFYDLRQEGDPSAAFDTWFEQEKQSRFDWRKPGLWQLSFHRLSDETFAVSLAEHHAILDGWSVASLFAELFAHYLGEPFTAPTPSFGTYVALEERALQEDGRFWADLLDGSEVTRLALLPGEVDGIAHLDVPIPEQLSHDLLALSDSLATPLKSVLLAVHLRVLALVCGTTDVVSGFVTNGRPENESGEQMLGLFLNTVPFRHLFLDESWRTCIQRVFETEGKMLPYRHFPLAEMQKMMGGEELFTTAFNYTHFHIFKGLEESGGLSVEDSRFHAPTHIPFAANFSRSLENGDVLLRLDYQDMPGTQVQTVGRYYQMALEHLVGHIDTSCMQLSFLRDEERHELLYQWNQTQVVHPPATAVHHLVIDACRRTPDATALLQLDTQGLGQQCSYGELLQEASRLAHLLRKHGAGPDRPVGICLPRSPKAIVAICAVLMAGSPYLPLDPAYPEERLAFMLEDSGAVLVVGPPALAAYCPVIDPEAASDEWGEPPEVTVDPAHGAYIIYTSGSTGTPKGVVVSHKAVLNQIFWRQAVFPMTSEDRLLQNLSLSFDPSVWQVFWPLSLGARLYLIPNESQRDIPWLASMMRRHRLTATAMVPSVLRVLLEEPDFLACDQLVHISCGGEALPAGLVQRFCQHFGENGVLHVVYGPTEATIDASTWEACEDLPTAVAPIGYPMHNVRLYVLDAYMEPVPAGVPGELYIAGTGLARGYLNRPALTADRYVPNPFEEEGERLYHTGDLVCLLPNGPLTFRGRIDHQVKVRGFRIELGEVEALLAQHKGVDEVVCLVREDRPGDKRLVAYVVGDAHGESLRTWLADKVPNYLVPAVFVALDTFPRLPNDKVNRHLLPAPEEADARDERTFTAPRNDRESVLARIWTEVLGLERVGVHDNFFQLGGDSILCIQVVARAREAGLHLNPRMVFEHPTVATLAEQANAHAVAAEQGLVEGKVPLTPILHWFEETGASQHFNQAVLLTVPNDLEPDLLQQALHQLASHHDALALRLQNHELAHDEQRTLPLTVAQPKSPMEMSGLIEATHKGFDLSSGPLMRALLLQMNTTTRLLLVAHHLVVDGVSWRVLLEDLQVLCTGGSLPPKTTSYKAWAERLVAYVDSGALDQEASYWLEQPEVAYPLDPGKVGESVQETYTLDIHETEQLLRQVPSAYQTRIDDVLLTALSRAWTQWSGSQQSLIGLESHGREDLFGDVDLSRTVGWFTAAYPVVLPGEKYEDIGAHLCAVKEILRQVPQGGIAYGLLRYLHPTYGPSFSRQPQPSLSFNYLGQIDQGVRDGLFQLAPESTGQAHDPNLERAFALELNGFIRAGQLHWIWTSPGDLDVAGLYKAFEHQLKEIIAYCLSPHAWGRTPSDFSLATLDQEAVTRLATPEVADLYMPSPMQKGMLFHGMTDQGRALYHQQLWFTFNGQMDVACFKQAWAELVTHHAILRTDFPYTDLSEPVQRVHHEVSLTWTEQDWPEGTSVEDWLALDRAQPFDLESAPLMRFTLLHERTDKLHFIWSHHHLLLDGWSLPLVLGELLTIYRALVAGKKPQLAPGKPYRAYIEWLAQQDETEAESWWRSYLGDFAEPTPLLGDRGEDSAVAHLHLDLPTELAAQIQHTVQSQRVTPNTLCAAAWSLTLAWLAGSDDVVFGQTVSGRSGNFPGVAETVGLLINTVPVRTRIPWQQTVEDWLQALQSEAAQREKYGWCFLTDLQRWSGVAPGMQLFDSVLVFENYPIDPALKADADLDWTLHPLKDRTDLPLAVSVVPGEGLAFEVGYNSGRFAEADVLRILDHLQTLLDALTQADGCAIAHCSPLRPEQRHHLLDELNQTSVAYPRDKSLAMCFQDQAAATPDAPAAVFGDEVYSYARLDRLTNGLAHRLRREGVGPEDLVAICHGRTPAFLIAKIAVAKAGACYLLLDPALPERRMNYILDDAHPVLALTELAHADRMGEIPVIFTDQVQEESDKAPTLQYEPNHGIYYIYTSGSTGKPKASINTQAGLLNLTHWLQGVHPLHQTDRMGVFTAISFDVFFIETWWPLTNGACIYILPDEDMGNPFSIGPFIAKNDITVMHLVPSLFRSFLECNEPFENTLRSVLCCGEAYGADLQNMALDWLGEDVQLVNCYGPSEASVMSSIFFAGGRQLNQVPIGEPGHNGRYYLVDRRGYPVPQGAPGELLIGGVYLARGYHRRARLTAERFIPDPFGNELGGRLYRTGDLVYRRHDDELIFMGRVDHQVKLRGMRIETGEIEVLLGRHTQVFEACVMVLTQNNSQQLIAFVRAENEVSTDSLTTWLGDQLPDYMVPALFVFMDTWPRLPSGKVDRKALAATPLDESWGDAEKMVPRTPTEARVADLFAEILEQPVGVNENFFQLGGHSLLATRLISAIKGSFAILMPFKQFFAQPTVAGVSRWLDEAEGKPQWPPIVPIDRGPDTPPLSYAQRRLWFLDQLEGQSATYNISIIMLVSGKFNRKAMEQAIHRMGVRHETLRTNFRALNGQPVLIIHPEPNLVPAYMTAHTEDEALALARSEALRPFDLANDALMRLVVVSHDPEQHVLLLTMHHIISDGWTLEVIVEELSKDYIAILAGDPAPATPLPIQYGDFSYWQHTEAVDAMLQEQGQWWREHLEGIPMTHQLPMDHPRPMKLSEEGGHVIHHLPLAHRERLDALGQAHGATRFMVLLAVFDTLLARYSQTDDLVVGTPIANRNHAAVEGMIGFFVNSLALRVHVQPDDCFVDLLGRVRHTALEAFARQDVPFERVVELCQPERLLNQTPLFQIMFSVQEERKGLNLPELTLTPVFTHTDTAKFDLLLQVAPAEDGLMLIWEYSRDLFERATIEQMAETYGRLAAAICDAPETRVDRLPLFSDAERTRVLALTNEKRCPALKWDTLQDMFEAQVEKTPDAPATLYEGRTWSYRALNEKANALAQRLLDRGVTPGDRVGVAALRTDWTMMGLLAILKIRCAYVPLDGKMPHVRLAQMIEDSDVKLILAPQEGRGILGEMDLPLLDLDADYGMRAQNMGFVGLSIDSAYVLFTSGSTGKPKGVLMPQRGIQRLVEPSWFVSISEGERVLQLAPMSFDVSGMEIWLALTNGGCLVIYPEGPLDLQHLRNFMREQRLDVAWHTVGLYNQMVDLYPDAFNTARQIISGGDQLSAAHVARFLEHNPQVVMTNGYGPTENGVLSTAKHLDLEGLQGGIAIGRPLDHTTSYVLDGHLQPQQPNVPGELCVGGIGLATCYVARPALTAERFIPDPFSQTPGARLYCTGDVVHTRRDGTLVFAGRRDGQVKIRGFRIELGEIEQTLVRHEAVAKAAVVVRNDLPGGKGVVAYWEGASSLTAQALDTWLREQMPAYMIPALLVHMEALPLNSNSKVDRKILSKQPLDTNGTIRQHVAPRTETERCLAQIWADVLQQEQIGITDNFFAMGGHSLLATSLAARVRETLGRELPVRAVFEHVTVEAMAAHIDASATADEAEIQLDPPGTLSSSQMRLWRFFTTLGATTTYNVPIYAQVDGHLNVAALEQALDAMVARHEILRTTFHQAEGEAPKQHIHPRGKAWFQLLHLEDENAAQALLTEESTHLFDLRTGPLMRFTLVRVRPDRHLLCLHKHHIITDGWSGGVFMRELGILYKAFASGDTQAAAVLPQPKMQFADYARRERGYVSPQRMNEGVAWWQENLRDLPVLKLKADKQNMNPSSKAGALPLTLTPELSKGLQALANDQNASVFMVLTGAFAHMLSHFSGQQDFAIGTPIAGRRRTEWEGLIGFMVGGLLLRARLAGITTFRQLVDHLRQVSLDAFANQDIPFIRVAQAVTAQLGEHPLLQVMITHQNMPAAAVNLPGLNITSLDLEVPQAKYDLTLAFSDHSNQLAGHFIYRYDLFSESTARSMLDHFHQLLIWGVQHPDQSFDHFSTSQIGDRLCKS